MPDENPSSSNPASRTTAAHALLSKGPSASATGDSPDSERKADRRPPADAEQEKAEQLGIRATATAVTGAPAYVRPSNLRRSSHALQLFGLLFVITLLLMGAMLAGMFSFYQGKIAPYLNRGDAAPASAAQPGASAVPSAVRIDVPQETRDEILAASAKISELQKQIDALRESSASAESGLREMSDRISQLRTSSSGAPRVADVAPTQATDARPDNEVNAITPVTTPANKELVVLKERNRLTGYADEAISTGSRKPLGLLIAKFTDPDNKSLRDAAYAEIQRVYYHLRFTSRIDPGFRIPVNEIFKDSGIRDEADLSTEQVTKLLHDQEQQWQVRLRAAWLLGGRRVKEVNEALMKAIKEDPVLDVAKEAQLSLEQNVDRKFLLLDVPAIDEWWKTQSEPKKDTDSKTEKPKAKQDSSSDSKKKRSK